MKQEGVEFLFHYLDDFAVVGPPNSWACHHVLDMLKRICAELGVPLAPKKAGRTLSDHYFPRYHHRHHEKGAEARGVARILLKGVLNLVSLTRPFLQLVGCIVLTSLATLTAFSLETSYSHIQNYSPAKKYCYHCHLHFTTI